MTKWQLTMAASLFVAPLVLWGPACSSSDKEQQPGTDAGVDTGDDVPTVSAALRGKVVDTNGAAVAGVTVALSGAETETDAEGGFSMNATPGKAQIVRLSKSGYITSAWSVDITAKVEAYLPVTMMALAPAQPLDATQGGTVVGARGAVLVAPPDAFAHEGGGAATGEVSVSLTAYDPAIPAEAYAYPGPLSGLTLQSELVPLRTYGVLDVTVTQNGAVLEVAPGKSLDIAVPAPSKGDKPATMRMWHFDTAQALWVEKPDLGTYDATSNTYSSVIGPGSRLDYTENSDNPYQPSCVHGMIVNAYGTPVAGAHVTAQSAAENDTVGIYSWMNTPPNGAFCMTVEKDQEVLLRIATPEGQVTERKFKAGSMHSNTYPADCSTSSCLQLQTIELGTPDTGQATEADCGIDMMSNPFATTCAAGLGDFYACFAPSGACHSELDMDPYGGTSYEITFENGAKIESGFDPLYPYPVTKFYGPGGVYCGKSVADAESVKIQPVAGGSFEFKTQPDGSMEVICDAGSFTMSAEQMDAMAACSGHAGDAGSGVTCDPQPGTFTAPCNFDMDCNTGLSCCGSGLDKECLLEAMCAVSCSSNVDCGYLGHDFVCCSNGLFDMCMLPTDCQ